MSVMVETYNLGRYFGPIKAVDGITFKVSRGEVLGFLGPNGAGKSTTMKMLSCFLTPSFGTAAVGGFDVAAKSKEVRAILGYLPENAPLYGEMTVQGLLGFIAEVRGIGAKAQRPALDRVIGLTGLENVLEQRVETLSKGYKRRVGLAQALINDPEVLILDEPTDGLDPNQKHEVRQLINKMASDKCIILSTHILEEVDAVCTRAVIIANGKIVADAAPDDLRKKSKSYNAVTITFPKGRGEDLAPALHGISGVREVQESRKGESLSYTLYPRAGENVLPAVVKEAEEKHWEFRDLYLETGQLDDVFREITQ